MGIEWLRRLWTGALSRPKREALWREQRYWNARRVALCRWVRYGECAKCCQSVGRQGPAVAR